MRKLFLFLLLAFSSTWASAQVIPIIFDKSEEKRDLREPPYWISSYDEFNDLQDEQKKFYLLHLFPQLEKVPETKKMSTADLESASLWYQDWDRMRSKISKYCDQNKDPDLCGEIADVRLQAFDVLTTRSDHPPLEASLLDPAK